MHLIEPFIVISAKIVIAITNELFDEEPDHQFTRLVRSWLHSNFESQESYRHVIRLAHFSLRLQPS
jgi:hypothetical protein